MSEENVDVLRRALEAFRRRDNEAALAFYDPDIEIRGILDDRVYRGLDGVREYFREWLSVWDEFISEVDEWIDARRGRARLCPGQAQRCGGRAAAGASLGVA